VRKEQGYFRTRSHSADNVAVLGSEEPHQVPTLSEGASISLFLMHNLRFRRSQQLREFNNVAFFVGVIICLLYH
jgi:hypothetical protein